MLSFSVSSTTCSFTSANAFVVTNAGDTALTVRRSHSAAADAAADHAEESDGVAEGEAMTLFRFLASDFWRQIFGAGCRHV